MLLVGIMTYSNNEQEIHDLQDISVFLDSSPAMVKGDHTGKAVKVRTSFTPQKKRISGRL